MATTRSLEVQQGIWIDEESLRSAGLGSQLQITVQSGEIRIVAAPTKIESQTPSEKGWSIFRSLGRNAQSGKLQNASVQHDRYLYGKAQ